jgi:predicted small lipoprotein YifL
MTIRSLCALAAAASLAACSRMGMNKPMMFSQASLPDSVKVPTGHQVAMETVGAGDISYECRAKVNAPGQHEWVFVGPDARLTDRGGKQVGKYYGPPATWESMDGSRLTGTQVAVAPNGTGNIPFQLVKANPAMGSGAMQGVSYIQRVATQGGVAPAMPCGASSVGQKQVVKYQADYIFYRAM